MSNEPGQILPDSKFGQLLTTTARLCKTAVETGTWNGLGSTVCILNGLPSDGHLWTVELDLGKFEEAKANHQEAIKANRVTFLHGTITAEDLLRNVYPPTDLEPTYESELGAVKQAVDVSGSIPESFDLLLIDGGVTCGLVEFISFAHRARFIALDDTNDFKNQGSLILAKDRRYELIAMDANDRNGWAIFERI